MLTKSYYIIFHKYCKEIFVINEKFYQPCQWRKFGGAIAQIGAHFS